MVYLSRPYPFKYFKGCLPQNLLSPLLNTLSHLILMSSWRFTNLKENSLIRHHKKFYSEFLKNDILELKNRFLEFYLHQELLNFSKSCNIFLLIYMNVLPLLLQTTPDRSQKGPVKKGLFVCPSRRFLLIGSLGFSKF